MVIRLKRHSVDCDMIEMYRYVQKFDNKNEYWSMLIGVFHEDSIDDQDIKKSLKSGDEVECLMTIK
jgi:hypothetical protein